MINYVEHYGLLRKKDSRGTYEPITEMHSWNSSSSPLLFRIQRHSDHHMHCYRPYQILRKIDNAPQLPYDYVNTFILAMCPPLWFRVMDARLPTSTDRTRKVSEAAITGYFGCVNILLTVWMVTSF
jgi:alkane 1-monooxygenase